MLKDQVKYYFMDETRSCSESVFRACNDEYGFGFAPPQINVAAGFSGGMFCQNVCGALTAGIMALSMLFTEHNNAHESPVLKEAAAHYVSRFTEVFGGTLCKDLTPQWKKEGERCLALVQKNADLLQEVIAQYQQK